MPTPIVLLTHTDADREHDYPAPALANLHEQAEVRLNQTPEPLQGDALAETAAGVHVIVSDGRSEGNAILFAASPDLIAFVGAPIDPRGVDLAAASALGILVTRRAEGDETGSISRQVAEILQGRAPEGAVNAEAALRLRRFAPPLAPEVGGVEGPEPTRYGDWQHKGRVSDF